MLNLTSSHSNHAIGYVQLVFGICSPVVRRFVDQASRLAATPNVPIELTVDHAGITNIARAKRIPWKQVVMIRDLGEAFIAVPRFGKGIPIAKRALPDGGSALWAALDAKLTASRYLVRGTDTRSTICNTRRNDRPA